MSRPYDGLVVLDLSRVLAGPLATTMLADLGATVIKVERRSVGDDTRAWGPPWTKTSSSYFDSTNRSKQSIELDFDDPADVAVARELAGVSDVIVENFRTGTLARFGLGYEDISSVNPQVVYCSVCGFGSGNGAHLPGYDFIVQAVGGLMSITGPADGPPTKVGTALVDVLTSKDAVIGVQAALAERSRTGLGQLVEVNLLSSLLGSLVNQAGAYLASGSSPDRMGNQHPSIAPYETLRCRDGFIAVACGNDTQFRRLAEAVGYVELATDPRYADNPSRVRHREGLVVALEEALSTRRRALAARAVSSRRSSWRRGGHRVGVRARGVVGPRTVDRRGRVRDSTGAPFDPLFGERRDSTCPAPATGRAQRGRPPLAGR